MKNPVKVSVLMLTYNHEAYIAEAINGVVKQQGPFSIELIIADDCSSDRTVSICRDWQQNYSDRIRIIENRVNVGVEKNFMQAYKQATGKYIAICEGDDFWIDARKLDRQIAFLEKNPDFSICFHRVVNFYEADNSKAFSNGVQQKITDIHDLARSNYITNVSVMYRRILPPDLPEWFAHVGTYDYAMHMLHAAHGKICFLNKPMAVYRHRKDAIWSTATAEKRWLISLLVREHLLNWFADRPEIYNLLRNSYGDISIALLRHYHANGESKKAERTLDNLLKMMPQWDRQLVCSRVKAIPKKGYVQLLKANISAMLSQVRREMSKFIPLTQIK